MRQLFYLIIYSGKINRVLRFVNKLLIGLVPLNLRLAPSGVMNINLEKGKVLKIKTNQTNYLTQLIFWNGYENFEYTKIFMDLVKNVHVFYDIGANIGYYSLLAAHVNKNMTVVGFEPSSGPLIYFQDNVKLNKLNVRIEALALTDSEGSSIFFEVQKNKYKYLDYNLSGEGNLEGYQSRLSFIQNKVQTLTLDKYVEGNTDVIDLIKIDTEGTEHLILKESDRVLNEMKPIIICETLFNMIEPELEEIMKKYDYKFYNHIGNHLVKVDSIKRKSDNGVRNCFFVHPDKSKWIQNYIC